jgi:pSer/pThr/pTyr-binding forkhead associated (FHA) protein
MDERTLTVEDGERTQMAAAVECPVCAEANAAGTEWCVECGFRLGTTPGETTEPEPRYALAGEGQRFILKPGENVVGRLNADIYLSDPSVSRRHAVVVVGPEGVAIRDEDSSNGTRMNDMRLPPGEESPLLPGESVQFGAVAFTLEAPEGVEVSVPPAPPARETASPDAYAAAAVPAVAVLTNGVDTWPLREGNNSIGRRADNDVTLPDRAVSGRHATITLGGGEARIADAGSTNGTFLNDQRLLPGAEEPLPAGAIIRFGPVVLNFEALPVDDTDTVAAAAPDGPAGDMDAGDETGPEPVEREADAG